MSKLEEELLEHSFMKMTPTLSGFVKLLDDQDFWFRNKALDAHRKWANSPEELEPLMANNKRLVAELLEKIPSPELANRLLSEDDHIIRSFCRKKPVQIRGATFSICLG